MANPQIFVKCRNCSCMSGPFKTLTDEELQLVDRNRTEITYRKGEMLCKQGSYISNTIFIKSGLVKIYLESGDHPIILSLEKDGYFLGIPSLYGDGVFHYSAEALTNTEVCQVDIQVYRALLETNAQFASRVLERANIDIVKAYNRIYSLTHKQIHGRFSELVMYLVDHIYETNPCDLTISRKDMADLIHTSPESVSRLIKEFNDDQTLRIDGHVLEILDREKLQLAERMG